MDTMLQGVTSVAPVIETLGDLGAKGFDYLNRNILFLEVGGRQLNGSSGGSFYTDHQHVAEQVYRASSSANLMGTDHHSLPAPNLAFSQIVEIREWEVDSKEYKRMQKASEAILNQVSKGIALRKIHVESDGHLFVPVSTATSLVNDGGEVEEFEIVEYASTSPEQGSAWMRHILEPRAVQVI